MIVYKFYSEQALLMAIEDFCLSNEWLNKDWFREIFIPHKTNFYAAVDPEDCIRKFILGEFLALVKKDPCYRNFFKIKLIAPDVRGFESLDEMQDIIDEYHDSQSTYYLDESLFETIDCLEGSLFVPIPEDYGTLEDFWRFATKLSSHRDWCRKGIEVTELEGW
jgi:hypothetical protein